ncbi:MAG: hypothetical protein DRQ99_28075, partial [Candidatus Parabeggiatoa sp. nov. 3]
TGAFPKKGSLSILAIRKITCIPSGPQNKFGTKSGPQNKFCIPSGPQNKFGTKNGLSKLITLFLGMRPLYTLAR